MEYIYVITGRNKDSKQTYAWKAFKRESKQEMEKYLEELIDTWTDTEFNIDTVQLH